MFGGVPDRRVGGWASPSRSVRALWAYSERGQSGRWAREQSGRWGRMNGHGRSRIDRRRIRIGRGCGIGIHRCGRISITMGTAKVKTAGARRGPARSRHRACVGLGDAVPGVCPDTFHERVARMAVLRKRVRNVFIRIRGGCFALNRTVALGMPRAFFWLMLLISRNLRMRSFHGSSAFCAWRPYPSCNSAHRIKAAIAKNDGFWRRISRPTKSKKLCPCGLSMELPSWHAISLV